MSSDFILKAIIVLTYSSLMVIIGMGVDEKYYGLMDNSYQIDKAVCLEADLIIYDKFCINEELSEIITNTLMTRK